MNTNIKKEIKYYLSKNVVFGKEYSYVKELLEKYRKKDSVYFLTNSARLELKYENYDKASEYLAALEEISPDNPFVYYNYYKINCLKENFEEAYINLHKCRELNSKEYNVTLPITMLEMLLDMKYNYSLFSNTDYSNTPIDRHITVNLSDRKIKAKYNEVAACIYEKDFQKASVELQELDKLVKSKEFSIEVDTMVLLNNRLAYTSSNTMLEPEDNYTESLDKARELEGKDLQRFIYDLSDTDPFCAKKVLDTYESKITFSKIRKVLKNKVEEKLYQLSLPEDKKKIYEDSYKNAKKALKEKKYSEALKFFKQGYQETGSITFIYYMGKTLYKAKAYDDALNCLLGYIEYGGAKYEKACLYLSSTYFRLRDSKNKLKYVNETKFVNHQLNRRFEIYNADANFPPNKKKNKTKEEVSFVSLFGNNDCSEELSLVENLYETDKIKEADKMLNNFNCSTEADRNKVKQLRNNRKLYINKNKFKS